MKNSTSSMDILIFYYRISFTVNDGKENSLPVYAHLTVAGDNDNAPVLTVVPANEVLYSNCLLYT